MTVKELIEILQKYDENRDVWHDFGGTLLPLKGQDITEDERENILYLG